MSNFTENNLDSMRHLNTTAISIAAISIAADCNGGAVSLPQDKSAAFIVVTAPPTKGTLKGGTGGSNTYTSSQLTYTASHPDPAGPFTDTFTYTYSQNDTSNKVTATIKCPAFSVYFSQRSYQIEQGIQSDFIRPQQNYSTVELQYSISPDVLFYGWMEPDRNFERSGAISFNTQGVQPKAYPVSITYQSADSALNPDGRFQETIVYDVDVFIPIFAFVNTVTGRVALGLFTGFCASIIALVYHKFAAKCGLPNFTQMGGSISTWYNGQSLDCHLNDDGTYVCTPHHPSYEYNYV
jgi:hypothetical protein